MNIATIKNIMKLKYQKCILQMYIQCLMIFHQSHGSLMSIAAVRGTPSAWPTLASFVRSADLALAR